MRSLTASDLLRVWELGLSQHPLDRALTVLQAAEPGESRAGLAALSVGRRDARLLEVYRLSFGHHLEGSAACPACGSRLEFQFPLDRALEETPQTESNWVYHADGYQVHFHPADSFDLAAAAQAPDVGAASRVLLERCVTQASRDGQPVAVHDLPEAVLAGLGERMAECDPQAEMLVNLTCPECKHSWQERLDVDAFLWAQLTVRAKKLLIEVHTLASAYGWGEADILAMNPFRRQAYLELLS